MAIQNNPNLYTAGNVVFDSRPATMFYLQSMAHKRAKEEAMDNYFRDLGKNLTPKGMSPDDVPEFISKSNAYKQFAIENRDALRNPSRDNGQALMQANSLYNDALEHSARSIGKVQNVSKIPNLNPDERERLMEHGWTAMQQATLPVSDPNYKPFSPSDIDYNPKQFTLDDESKLIENLTKNRKRNEVVELGPTDQKTFLRNKTTIGSYDIKDLQGMGEQSASEYATNKSYKQEIDKLFNSFFNPKTQQVEIPNDYNAVFKSVYGKDIHTPQELAAARSLNVIQSNQTKTEQEEDKFAQAKYLEGLKQGGRLALLKKRQQYVKANKQEQGLYLDAYIQTQIDDAKKQPATTYKNKDGTEITEYQLKVSPMTKKIFETTNAAGQHIYPDVVRIMPNGDYHPIFFERDETGKIKQVNNKASVIKNLSQPVSKDEYKVRLGQQLLSDKGLSAEMEAEFDDAENEEEYQPTSTAPLPTKYKAKMANGDIITSDDGTNWVDAKGNPIK